MPLASYTQYPPLGFAYREPKTGWVPKDTYQAFEVVAKELQRHRKQNPTKFTAEETTIIQCRTDLEVYTCQRLKGQKWCFEEQSDEEINRKRTKQRQQKKAQPSGGCCGRSKKAR